MTRVGERTFAIPQVRNGGFYARAGVEGEAATMRPARHRLGVFRLEHTASGQRAQQTPADFGMDFVE
jgi:hypothetical protein